MHFEQVSISFSTNFREMVSFSLRSIPPVTVLLLVLFLSVFLIRLLTNHFNAGPHTIKPKTSLDPSDFYLIVTSPVVHSSVLYLVLVEVSLLYVGTRLEKKLGTMLFLRTVINCWLGSIFLFFALGMLLYLTTAFPSWLGVKHIGFAPILISLTVIDSYIGKRDVLNMFLPWVLIPVLPLILYHVSALSLLSGAIFGLMMTRTGLGTVISPTHDQLVVSESSWLGTRLNNSFSSFCPVFSTTDPYPFEQSRDGPICFDVQNQNSSLSREQTPLMALSSKAAQTVNKVAETASATADAIKISVEEKL